MHVRMYVCMHKTNCQCTAGADASSIGVAAMLPAILDRRTRKVYPVAMNTDSTGDERARDIREPEVAVVPRAIESYFDYTFDSSWWSAPHPGLAQAWEASDTKKLYVYHGTSRRAAESIAIQGLNPSARGMLGPVRYAGVFAKAARFAAWDSETYERRTDPAVILIEAWPSNVQIFEPTKPLFDDWECACGDAACDGSGKDAKPFVDHAAKWCDTFGRDCAVMYPARVYPGSTRPILRTAEWALGPDVPHRVVAVRYLDTSSYGERYDDPASFRASVRTT